MRFASSSSSAPVSLRLTHRFAGLEGQLTVCICRGATLCALNHGALRDSGLTAAGCSLVSLEALGLRGV